VQRDRKTKICDACLIYFTVLQQGMKQKKRYNVNIIYKKKKLLFFTWGVDTFFSEKEDTGCGHNTCLPEQWSITLV
jgi:hypothetical protein